jgi:hypothetical protein
LRRGDGCPDALEIRLAPLLLKGPFIQGLESRIREQGELAARLLDLGPKGRIAQA